MLALQENQRIERENLKRIFRGKQAEHKQLQAANEAYQRLLKLHGIPDPQEPAATSATPWVRMRPTCMQRPAGGC